MSSTFVAMLQKSSAAAMLSPPTVKLFVCARIVLPHKRHSHTKLFPSMAAPPECSPRMTNVHPNSRSNPQ
eukprot:scaffold143402_cov18-Tisochrysis_lutea.AAC.2